MKGWAAGSIRNVKEIMAISNSTKLRSAVKRTKIEMCWDKLQNGLGKCLSCSIYVCRCMHRGKDGGPTDLFTASWEAVCRSG